MEQAEKLLLDLQARNLSERHRAFEKLKQVKSGFIDEALELIVHSEEQHLEWTLEGFDWETGEGGTKHNFDIIEDTMSYDFFYVPAISKLLIHFKNQFLPQLIENLNHQRLLVRCWVAYILGEIRDLNTEMPLLDRLHDAQESLEVARISEALGKLKSNRAVPRLIELLNTKDAGVLSSAIVALGNINDDRALTPLIRKIKVAPISVISALYHFKHRAVQPLLELLGDEDSQSVHDVILMGLYQIGDTKAIEPIVEYLQHTKSDKLKQNAMIALGFLKANDAVAEIEQYLQSAVTSDVRWSAAISLGRIGTIEAFNALMEALRTGSDEVRHSAALALGELEVVADLEPVLSMLEDPNPNIRSAIIVSLGNLGDKRAIPVLQHAINDLDENVRRYAEGSIQKLSSTHE